MNSLPLVRNSEGLSGRQKNLIDAALFVLVLGISMYFSQSRRFPFLYSDEYGVLGAAGVLGGLDWSAPPGIPFYGFGLSLFASPFYCLDLSPDLLYRAALAFNGLFVALSAVLSARILRIVSKEGEGYGTAVVLAAFCYPAVIFYSCLALGESALLFSLALMTWSLAKVCMNRDRYFINSLLLGLSAAFSPYAHSRGAVLVIALILVVLPACIGKIMPKKSLLLSTTVFAAVFILLRAVKNFLLAEFYSTVMTGTDSVAKFAENRLGMLTFSHLSTIFQVCFGQLTYLASSTFGIFFLGIAGLCASFAFFVLKRREMGRIENEAAKTRFVLTAFILLAFLGMLAASVLHMLRPYRADHFFYGRYNEVLVPFLLIAGLLTFTEGKKRAGTLRFAAALGIAACMIFAVHFYPKEIFGKVTTWTQITGWFVYIPGAWRIYPLHILLGVLTGGSILLLAIAVSRYLPAAVLCVFFLGVAAENAKQFSLADSGWSQYVTVHEVLSKPLKGKTISLPPENVAGGEALQMALPYSRVIFDGKEPGRADLRFESEDALSFCNESNTVAKVRRHRICALEPALLDDLRKTLGLLDARPPMARLLSPAEISLEKPLSSEQIVLSGPLWRGAAFLSRTFYTRWAGFFLPSVFLKIRRDDAAGTENYSLGYFISDKSGKWLRESRVSLDLKNLAKGQAETKRIHLPLFENFPRGEYALSFAIVDESGWDWRSVRKVTVLIR